uniref:LAGLIDADG homing endonuclease n=1 Tax=Termitomyces sp. TaxID=1916073 RepID=A0A386TYK7_9AGAR|nr:LAGLIDADG homing endonuclease [Termitomyces sp.]
MREIPLIGSKYLFYIFNGVVKMLLTWGQLARVILLTLQRLNVEHPYNMNLTNNINTTALLLLLRRSCPYGYGDSEGRSSTLRPSPLRPSPLLRTAVEKGGAKVGFPLFNLPAYGQGGKGRPGYKNKELFYQWLVGFTDGDGTFSIAHQNGKWSLAFKLSQHEYNARILYFIKSQLGIGNINKEDKTKMVNYRIRDRKKLLEIIFPIFDKNPLLTSKYFYYLKFKEAFNILEDSNYTKTQKDELMYNLVKRVPSESYISPVWEIINNQVNNNSDANKVMSKAWLIGFTEAEGSFYLVNKSTDRIVHGFEITQKLDLIVLSAIACILGIKTTSKKTYHTVVTTNSRSIENIIKYYNNTMKGMKAFEFRVWARSFVKHKGDFTKLNEIRNKIRSRKLGTTIFTNS